MKNAHPQIKITSGKPHWEILSLLASDLFGFGGAFGLALFARWIIFPSRYVQAVDPQVIRTMVYVIVFTLCILLARDLYPGWGRSSVVELKQVVESLTLAYIISAVIVFIRGTTVEFSRSVFLLSWVFVVLLVPINRFLTRKYIAKTRWWGEPVVIMGCEREIIEVRTKLMGCPRLGLRPVIGLALDGQAHLSNFTSAQFQIMPWCVETLQAVISTGVQTNVLAIPVNELRVNYPNVLGQIELSFQKTIFVLDQDFFSIMMAQAIEIGGQPGIIVRQSLLNYYTRLVKQVFEFVLLMIVILPVLILGLIIAILIKLDTPGPIFYIQRRIGRYGKPFDLIKFRTMVINSDQVLQELLEDPKNREEWELHHKLSDDRRITRVGKWLRKMSLDELPQFINILRGEMALIGPRPLISSEIESIHDVAATILRVKPGMTGWWQVMGRNRLTFEERTKLDLYYVFNWSLWLDLFIFIKTFWIIVSGE